MPTSSPDGKAPRPRQPKPDSKAKPTPGSTPEPLLNQKPTPASPPPATALGPLRHDLVDFLDAIRVESGVARNTIAAYRHDLEGFLARLHAAGLNEWDHLQPHDVIDHMAGQRAIGAAEASIARSLAAIRMFFAHLIAEGRLHKDPCSLISAPHLARYLPSVLSIEQVDALLATPTKDTWIDSRDRALLEILYATGARVSEAVTLETSALEPKLGVLRLTGKGNKTRIVPMGTRAAEALHNWLTNWRRAAMANVGAKSGPKAGSKATQASESKLNANDSKATKAKATHVHDFVFVTKGGNPLDRVTAWRRVKALALRAGIRTDISPHTLRHSFASHLVAGGADLRAVQEMLGHASIRTTEVYTHLDAEQVRGVHRLYHPRG
jgi:integrase/recombinase XerD